MGTVKNIRNIRIEITWIRHGKTKGNEEYRYIGRTDEGLSGIGIKEIEEKKSDYSEIKPDYIYSSAMKRCIQTARLLFDKEPKIIEEFNEMDFGDFEGKNYHELNGDTMYQEWIDSNGELPFPGGEAREEFIKRCMTGYEKMLEDIKRDTYSRMNCKTEVRSDDKICISVAAVVHGGTIMAVMSSLQGGEYFDYQIGNAECRKIEVVSK